MLVLLKTSQMKRDCRMYKKRDEFLKCIHSPWVTLIFDLFVDTCLLFSCQDIIVNFLLEEKSAFTGQEDDEVLKQVVSKDDLLQQMDDFINN